MGYIITFVIGGFFGVCGMGLLISVSKEDLYEEYYEQGYKRGKEDMLNNSKTGKEVILKE